MTPLLTETLKRVNEYFRFMYLYLKALHIIFIVTWFAGLFYMPRLFIYNTEASEKEPVVRDALRSQFSVMMKRLWFGITWPSAILTLILGPWVLFNGGWHKILFQPEVKWLLVKLIFVVFLYAYHVTLHVIFKQELSGKFKYSSQQLRAWKEVATIFLIAIVMLVVVKQNISLLWGLGGLIAFIFVLMSAIKIYKGLRSK
jgi:putative membrane protein